MDSLNALIERGHTVLIIEHNMDVIKCADNIIDLGPEGGSEGGYLVFEGTPEELITCEASYTGNILQRNCRRINNRYCLFGRLKYEEVNRFHCY